MTNVNLVETLTVDSSAIFEVSYYPNVEKDYLYCLKTVESMSTLMYQLT